MTYFIGLLFVSVATGYLTDTQVWGFFTFGAGLMVGAAFDSITGHRRAVQALKFGRKRADRSGEGS